MTERPETLRILQYNVQKSKNKVMEPLFHNEIIRQYDVIAIQEPWKNVFQNTSMQAGNLGFQLIYPNSTQARACIYVNNRIDTNQWDAIEHSPDLVTLRLRTSSGTIHIHSVYSQPPGSYTSPASKTLEKLEKALESEGHYIVVGDFNIHHRSWGGNRCQVEHSAAERLLEVTIRFEMQQALPPGTIIWTARGGKQILDLI